MLFTGMAGIPFETVVFEKQNTISCRTHFHNFFQTSFCRFMQQGDIGKGYSIDDSRVLAGIQNIVP